MKNKASNKTPIKAADQPGECASVDSFESSTAGFTAQIKGTQTNNWYRVATM